MGDKLTMPLAVGTRLGPYEIAEPIGAGGMGEVYRAKDSLAPEFQEYFEREILPLSEDSC